MYHATSFSACCCRDSAIHHIDVKTGQLNLFLRLIAAFKNAQGIWMKTDAAAAPLAATAPRLCHLLRMKRPATAAISAIDGAMKSELDDSTDLGAFPDLAGELQFFEEVCATTIAVCLSCVITPFSFWYFFSWLVGFWSCCCQTGWSYYATQRCGSGFRWMHWINHRRGKWTRRSMCVFFCERHSTRIFFRPFIHSVILWTCST